LRGLLVWLPLQLHGVARFRAELDRMLGLAAVAAARLSQIPQIEVLMPPALSIVVFRARAGEEATDRILAAINNSGRFHVSSTTLQGHAAIRLAFLHPRTTVEHVDAVARIVRQAAA
jgi:aromatic-L-amino-acid decarboxylase